MTAATLRRGWMAARRHVWVADCLDLPGCYTLGWSEQDARQKLRDKIRDAESLGGAS